ncbi:unknown [Brachyspira sp. CAG:700]|nr:unknown [Brachyspira sp. CAG:700]
MREEGLKANSFVNFTSMDKVLVLFFKVVSLALKVKLILIVLSTVWLELSNFLTLSTNVVFAVNELLANSKSSEVILFASTVSPSSTVNLAV